MKAKEIDVTILGKSFSFMISGKINTDDFLEIVNYVEENYTKIRNNTDEYDPFRLGLLTSINITEEFFHLKKENDKLKSILDNIDSIVTTVDKGDVGQISFTKKSKMERSNG